MTEPVLIALGSNVGDRAAYLAGAVESLETTSGLEYVSSTAVVETEPIGPEQPSYLNQMVLAHCERDALDLLRALQAIEDGAGRTRGERWGPRTLDLDIVWFGSHRSGRTELTIPHPEFGNRSFWLDQATQLLPRTWKPADHGWPDWAEVTTTRFQHIQGVAGLLAAWAIAMDVGEGQRNKWLQAAYLHDALKDAPSERLADLSGEAWGQPALYHGPAAARRARDTGVADTDVLEAVQYHTTGHAGWRSTGRMLYMADVLEPGRKHQPPNRDELVTLVTSDPVQALRDVAAYRRDYVLDNGFFIPEETREFWTTLNVAVE